MSLTREAYAVVDRVAEVLAETPPDKVRTLLELLVEWARSAPGSAVALERAVLPSVPAREWLLDTLLERAVGEAWALGLESEVEAMLQRKLGDRQVDGSRRPGGAPYTSCLCSAADGRLIVEGGCWRHDREIMTVDHREVPSAEERRRR